MGRDQSKYLLQLDLIEFVLNHVGEEAWTDVYKFRRDDLQTTSFYSALLPPDQIVASLSSPSWDFSIGYGLPGCESYSREGNGRVVYYRFGHPSPIEPFVLYRNFHDIRPSYLEVIEEFRLFHNLYFDFTSGKYLSIHDDGSEEEVLEVGDDRVRVKTLALRQFLAIKEMYLAFFIDSVRFSPIHIDEVDPEELDLEITDQRLNLLRYIREADFLSSQDKRTFSRLFGKKLIAPVAKENSGIWPYSEENGKQFESFIIGVDSDGNVIEFTANPDELSNYYGDNPHAPHYLTPVYFRREVLSKYYSNPEKFSVGDSCVSCGSLWLLRIDNNLASHVAVFLGDLGRDIPHSEQLYWKSFNVPPEGSISDVYFRRSMLAEFAEPESKDLVFKSRYRKLNAAWVQRYGWPLYLPPTEDDAHLFEALHIPLTKDQAEFDSQVLALTKVMIDSLNEAKLEAQIKGLEPDAKGITKLGLFLEQSSFPATTQKVAFLRDLQELRSRGVVHRKGSKYTKIAEKFKLDRSSPINVFENILEEAIIFIDLLDRHYLEQS